MNSANSNTEDLLKGLFEFKNDDQELDHKAHMIAFRFLSEIQKLADTRNLKRKDLAELINTSPSFLTQIFRGDKLPNFTLLAKIEKALAIEFNVRIGDSPISYENLNEDELHNLIIQYNRLGKGFISYHNLEIPDYSKEETKVGLKETSYASEYEIMVA